MNPFARSDVTSCRARCGGPSSNCWSFSWVLALPAPPSRGFDGSNWSSVGLTNLYIGFVRSAFFASVMLVPNVGECFCHRFKERRRYSIADQLEFLPHGPVPPAAGRGEALEDGALAE